MTIDRGSQNTPDPTSGLGLRERKKQATRDALVEAALELFAAQGVDDTTVEQIADRVAVSPRTFHRYFETKDAVLFADTAGRAAQIAAVLDGDDGRRPVLEVLTDAATALASMIVADYPRSAQRFRIIEANDHLRGRFLRVSEEIADLCAAYVARRLGLDQGDRLPRLVGTCTVGVIRTAHRRWIVDPALDITAEVRASFALLADLEPALTTGATGQRAHR